MEAIATLKDPRTPAPGITPLDTDMTSLCAGCKSLALGERFVKSEPFYYEYRKLDTSMHPGLRSLSALEASSLECGCCKFACDELKRGLPKPNYCSGGADLAEHSLELSFSVTPSFNCGGRHG